MNDNNIKTYYTPFLPQHVTGRMSAKISDASPQMGKRKDLTLIKFKHERFLAEAKYFSRIKILVMTMHYLIEYEISH